MAGKASGLTHLDAGGKADMVDVGAKAETERTAVAEGTVTMQAGTLRTILEGNAKQGDVLGAARIAGIMAAKKTHELIPLCHPLLLTKVAVDIEADENAWDLQLALMDFLEGHWGDPDNSLWEVRGDRRHFVHSKVLAWAGVDRMVQ